MSTWEDDLYLNRTGGHEHTCSQCRFTRVCYNVNCTADGTEAYWECGFCMIDTVADEEDRNAIFE